MQKKDQKIKISLSKLENIYKSTDLLKGWDFSSMKTEKESAPWDYLEIIRKYIKPSDYVLDIGTGGGEKIIKLSKYFAKGVGIDLSLEMINTARKNAKKSKNTKVSFMVMAAENIQFPPGTFDIVLNRHAVVVPKEITRVLKSGGYFITQQVEKNNMKNIKQAFDYKKTWENDVSFLSREFRKYSCRVIASGRYNVSYWVKNLESLIFWLKAVDLPENFNIKDHGSQLLKLIKKNNTPEGYITNESREFLIVKKI